MNVNFGETAPAVKRSSNELEDALRIIQQQEKLINKLSNNH